MVPDIVKYPVVLLFNAVAPRAVLNKLCALFVQPAHNTGVGKVRSIKFIAQVRVRVKVYYADSAEMFFHRHDRGV